MLFLLPGALSPLQPSFSILLLKCHFLGEASHGPHRLAHSPLLSVFTGPYYFPYILFFTVAILDVFIGLFSEAASPTRPVNENHAKFTF